MYKPIISKKLGVNRWFVFSKKLNREVRLYGQLEYDHWVLIEMDPQVINYCEKPLEINHSYFGRPDTALIDMWVKRKSEEEFINIAYSHQLDSHNENFNIGMFEKINAVKLWTQSNNHSHIVTMESDIYSNSILLENKKRLLPYNYDIASLNLKLKDRIINHVKKGLINIMDLEVQLLNETNIYDFQKALYMLIIQELVSSNIDQKPLGPETKVFLR